MNHVAPGGARTTVTLTANPSLDRTLEVKRLVRGSVLRAESSRLDPGGKGVNVSRALTRHGLPTVAVIPVGGADGARLVDGARAAGVTVVPVPVVPSTRSNVAVAEPDGTVTKINEPGSPLSEAEWQALLHAVAATMAAASAPTAGAVPAGWLVASGSLPPGAPPDMYAQLVRRAHAADWRAAVDSSGPPLAATVAAGPDLLAPNRLELGEVSHLPVSTIGEVVTACRAVQREGAGAVLASLGCDGAVLVDRAGAAWHADTPSVPVRSAVGAGDALLAGYLAAGGNSPDALAQGVAWGAAAAALPGSVMPGPAEVARARAAGVMVSEVTDSPARDRQLSD